MIQNIKGKRVPLFFRQTEFLSPFFFLISFPLFLYTERLKLITNYTMHRYADLLNPLLLQEFKNHLIFSPPPPMIAGKQPQSRSGNKAKRAYHRRKKREAMGQKGEEEFNGRVYARS